MKIKKHNLFLIISFILFVVSLIHAIIVSYDVYLKFMKIENELLERREKLVMQATLCWSWFFIGIILLVELSFIRSVYKMIKHKPLKGVLACYIISASLSFISIFLFYNFFYYPTFNHIFSANIVRFWGLLCLCTLIPFLILSFILGSIPIKKRNTAPTYETYENTYYEKF